MPSTRWFLALAVASAFALGACTADAGDGTEDGMDDAADEIPAETMDTPDPAPTGGAAPQIDPAALPEGVTQQMIDAGQQIFVNAGFCYTCHGQDATGGQLAPNLTDDTWIHAENGDFEQIVGVVTSGIPEPVEFPTPMQPMGGGQLTAAQVREVSAYVWSLSGGG